MAGRLRALERQIYKLLGPAMVTRPEDEPEHPPLGPPKELIPGGYERRGTPGSYYIVRKDS